MGNRAALPSHGQGAAMKTTATSGGKARRDVRTRASVSWFGLLVAAALAAPSLSCSDSCTQPLSASGCPATYEAIGESVCTDCRAGTAPCPEVATCGSFLVFETGGGYGGGSCYYDVTTRTLVASHGYSDIKSFCEGSSFTFTSGVSVGNCGSIPASELAPYCPAAP